MKKRSMLAIFSAFAFSAVVAGALTMTGVTAKAADEAFWLKDGASVRVGTNGNGIRYTFQITEEAYNS